MARFIGKRILQMVPVLIFATIVLFVVLRLVPGDPARQILGKEATPQQIEQKRDELGLNEPIVEQYLDWVKGIPQGNLGNTYAADQPVSELVAENLPVTLQLVAFGLLVAVLVSLPMALYSAERPGGKVDNLLTALSVASTSVPGFVWGLAGVLLFSITLKLLPSSGYTPFSEDPARWLEAMMLPAAALSIPTMGTVTRVARASMLDVQAQPYMTFARSKGLARSRLLMTHVLKNSAVPIIAVTGAEFAYLLGDAVIVESIFSIPGTGKLMIDAFFNRDYAVIQGVAIVYTLLVLVSGLLADIAAAKVDSRIKLSGSSA